MQRGPVGKDIDCGWKKRALSRQGAGEAPVARNIQNFQVWHSSWRQPGRWEGWAGQQIVLQQDRFDLKEQGQVRHFRFAGNVSENYLLACHLFGRLLQIENGTTPPPFGRPTPTAAFQ